MFSRELYPNYIYIGANCFGLDAKVPFANEVSVNGSTVLGGVNIGYEYLRPSFFYAGLDFAFSTGGSSLDFEYANKIVIAPSDDIDLLFGELRLGYTASYQKWLLTPCTGLGVYFISSLEDDSVSLDIPYALLSLHTLYQKSPLFDIGLNLTIYGEFNKQFSGKIERESFHISTTSSDWGGRLAIPLIWHIDITRRWELRLEPFVTSLSFSNTELLYGANFLAGYHF